MDMEVEAAEARGVASRRRVHRLHARGSVRRVGWLKEKWSDVSMMFGYITKNTRIWLGREKPRVNDARRIAGSLDAKPMDTVVMRKKARRKSGSSSR